MNGMHSYKMVCSSVHFNHAYGTCERPRSAISQTSTTADFPIMFPICRRTPIHAGTGQAGAPHAKPGDGRGSLGAVFASKPGRSRIWRRVVVAGMALFTACACCVRALQHPDREFVAGVWAPVLPLGMYAPPVYARLIAIILVHQVPER